MLFFRTRIIFIIEFRYGKITFTYPHTETAYKHVALHDRYA
ncbi:hypothetical protein TFKS16_0231 [Tannerella forsythia KS16]|uniref:Uncharacterized protein n=1 Tax=Tannerella forsythia (strain ATCC 43037 / JCM 10827 / CCUG 21028 A / KCTC 5666 / FDC 338) TaxID=203275 RepID=G8UJ07_TANFA|nr:hypothetical protein BFO_0235 [Tannerella forsythia 92A2]BAR47808.1 hypothetical protein TF3313_0203 [Tannerella forsythia 3313]BAR50570.1 hypothetical protein TFKS16_0231 [Tannerella forsythia KS16]